MYCIAIAMYCYLIISLIIYISVCLIQPGLLVAGLLMVIDAACCVLADHLCIYDSCMMILITDDFDV